MLETIFSAFHTFWYSASACSKQLIVNYVLARMDDHPHPHPQKLHLASGYL
jgi:hypothetical protein